jgi:carbon-monoxide dehydrogenase small subunit
MKTTIEVSITVNGIAVRRIVEARTHLVDFLRNALDLTGAHVGCEHGVCGACTVLLDGRIVRGCLTLAVQADGGSIETIEGLTERGEIDALQQAFHERNAVQCGYCTSGMLLTSAELIATHQHAERAKIREYMSGNYCRCTGYQSIVDAIESVLISKREGTGKQ